MRIRHISCGEEHTVLLTEVYYLLCIQLLFFKVLYQNFVLIHKDGGVFTYGASTKGQLGHSSNHHEYQPRKVCVFYFIEAFYFIS